MRAGILLMALAAPLAAVADEHVAICYNYGCADEVRVRYSERRLRELRTMLRAARNAQEERFALGRAVGRLYAWAGAMSVIASDRGGDYADDGANGRMDCIDHATSTTRLLQMMERRGWLRFHRVLEPQRRTRFLIMQHFTAVIEERTATRVCLDCEAARVPRYAVDSWFYDSGTPAELIPLEEWFRGAGPLVN